LAASQIRSTALATDASASRITGAAWTAATRTMVAARIPSWQINRLPAVSGEEGLDPAPNVIRPAKGRPSNP
jgi:hypothetical protein